MTGLAHHVEVTGANVHDVTIMPKLLIGEETQIYGDSGYLGAEKRKDAVTYNKLGIGQKGLLQVSLSPLLSAFFGLMLARAMLFGDFPELLPDGLLFLCLDFLAQHGGHVLFGTLHTAVIILLAVGRL